MGDSRVLFSVIVGILIIGSFSFVGQNSAYAGTIGDNTPPQITCPPNITIEAGESINPSNTGEAPANDSFDPNPSVTFTDVVSGFAPTTVERTWTATDSSGNSSSCVQIITIEPLEVEIDIKPNSCPNPVNVLSKGLVPVAILGTAEFNVNDIDISTLPDRTQMHTIEDVAAPFGGPVIGPLDCTEAGPDGFDDLIFKIPTTLLNCLPDGTLASLTIDGQLLDGTPFEGFDLALVINKKACP